MQKKNVHETVLEVSASGTNPSFFVPCLVAISCSDPGHVVYSTKLGSNYTYGQSVQYVCNRGYLLLGHAFLTCQDDGSWNGSLPICKPVLCPSLPTPRWSYRNSSNFSHGSAVTFQCSIGFRLSGNKTTTCQWNGQWDTSLPRCNPVDCGEPRIIEHAKIIRNRSTYGGTADVICNDGYTWDREQLYTITCQADGLWSKLSGACTG